MKRLLIVAVLLGAVLLPAHAQFEKGKAYISGAFDGLGVSYSSATKFSVGLGVNAGYLVADDWMLLANIGGKIRHHYGEFDAGFAGRFYFEQNGIYLQAGAKYQYAKGNCGSVALCPEVGYCHYLNGHLTIEPAIYADFSLNDFSKSTSFGVKIGIGYYF